MQVVERFLGDVLLLRRDQASNSSNNQVVFDYCELVAIGFTSQFVQDNQSHSKVNVLRGLHYQILQAQGKLIRVLSGEIFTSVVDLRCFSDTFIKSAGELAIFSWTV